MSRLPSTIPATAYGIKVPGPCHIEGKHFNAKNEPLPDRDAELAAMFGGDSADLVLDQGYIGELAK